MGQHCVTFPFHLVCFGEEKSVIQNFLAEVLLIKVKMPTCAICKIEAPSEKHLKVHIKAKHDDRVLTCEKCEKKMYWRDEAEDTHGISQGSYMQTL